MMGHPSSEMQAWLETLQRTTTEPSSLDALCQEPTISNPEIFKPNHYYGNAAILKRYAGYPLKRPLKAVLQHGIYLYDSDFTAGGELDAPLPLYLPPTEERAKIYRRLSHRPAEPIGISLLYAKALLEEYLPTAVERTGTLVFISHSTRYITKKMDHQAYADTLANLPDEYHPITISAYWKDYQEGAYAPYLEKGFRLITAGHMMDPDFIARFYLHCRRFKYACANEVGSHLFFAVESGCSFFMLPSGTVEWVASDARHLAAHGRATTDSSQEERYRSIYQLFETPQPVTTPEQQAFVDTYTGKAFFRSPETLVGLFKQADYLDFFSFQPRPQADGHKTAPWFYQLPTGLQRQKFLKRLLKPVLNR